MLESERLGHMHAVEGGERRRRKCTFAVIKAQANSVIDRAARCIKAGSPGLLGKLGLVGQASKQVQFCCHCSCNLAPFQKQLH